MHWQKVNAGNYRSGRYKIVRDDSGTWLVTVYDVEDQSFSKLADARSRVAEIEDLKTSGDDPYWGGKQRFYAGGKRRKNVKGWD